ncbi:MAG: hypothetical protein HRT57_11795 [Crocinitomicaceae bacterium]|nr:hypothetical protein [Crocinitomicaceae bacterium]
MRYLRILFVALITLSITGCVEIIDDLTLNLDGSGSFKYNINLSSSKIKINSILALDSLDGKKVPSIYDIKRKINRLNEKLKSEAGISNVSLTADYTNFIFKLSCDFTSLSELQSAIKTIALSENNGKAIPELDHNWLIFSGTTLNRSVPEITIKKSKEIKNADRLLLKEGSYTSITRFESEIEKFDNDKAKLSANKKAIMLRTDPYSLTQNYNLLDNTIYLKKTE